MPSQFWVKTGDKVQGPFSGDQLRQLAAGGKLKTDHPVSQDQQKWVAAGKVKGLQFAAASEPVGQTPPAEMKVKSPPRRPAGDSLLDFYTENLPDPTADTPAMPAAPKTPASPSFSPAAKRGNDEVCPREQTRAQEYAKTQLNPRCMKCGERRCHRIVHKSIKWVGMEPGQDIDDPNLTRGWFWLETAVCLKCESVPCMVENCAKRAEIRLPHSFRIGEHGTQFWRQYGIEITNDLWLCDVHGPIIKRFRLMRIGGIGIACIGALTFALAFGEMYSKVLGITLGSLAFLAGAGLVVGAMIMKSQQKLNKKKEYIERLRAPSLLEHYAWSGPWTDDGFTPVSSGKPTQN